MVRAAMTCSFGIVKVQYQRVTQGEADPIIRQRISDSQDNIQRLEALAKDLEDEQGPQRRESKKRELEEALARAAGAVRGGGRRRAGDRPRSSDRLVIDPAVEDFWEYETAAWMAEKIPMRKSEAKGKFPDFDLSTATVYKVGDDEARQDGQRAASTAARRLHDRRRHGDGVGGLVARRQPHLHAGGGLQQAVRRRALHAQVCGERWWPYFILPFQSVDGEFAAQSLVDLLERLQEEHNETRDKFAEVRRKIRPHHIAGPT
jgi:hypothetical protein